jgi:hypothetical protein
VSVIDNEKKPTWTSAMTSDQQKEGEKRTEYYSTRPQALIEGMSVSLMLRKTNIHTPNRHKPSY